MKLPALQQISAIRIFSVIAILVSPGCLPQLYGQARAIDTQHSKIVVHVSKAGLFAAFGDNHEVEAPIARGSIDEAARQVEFLIEARRMKVLDPQLSPEKRREVEQRMLGPDVLDVVRFPEIRFESQTVEEAGPGRLLIHGRLSLHGMVRPLTVRVGSQNGRYSGAATLKQREFGINPVSVAGGTVKVKDELRIEFEITATTQAAVSK